MYIDHSRTSSQTLQRTLTTENVKYIKLILHVQVVPYYITSSALTLDHPGSRDRYYHPHYHYSGRISLSSKVCGLYFILQRDHIHYLELGKFCKYVYAMQGCLVYTSGSKLVSRWLRSGLCPVTNERFLSLPHLVHVLLPLRGLQQVSACLKLPPHPHHIISSWKFPGFHGSNVTKYLCTSYFFSHTLFFFSKVGFLLIGNTVFKCVMSYCTPLYFGLLLVLQNNRLLPN